ncbi:DNA-(apurinic or apyrimidinic site) lyase [Microbacterium sp. cf046]|uniref:Fpg/Nei family DNA glycosylase n=1 Tax=Microbacterium sp. cf046 TaxID=1761803 RepID=UPI0008F3C0A4|nr:DNA-formamidopyrimidine glycosylase family protein [Microbacterium sp. cf046]SFS08455.1 DNA-(apurinic or apyrimidinic site) lyase [Microbacterium sp. cf046]
MPESPEVQELASFLTAHAAGHVLTAMDVLLPKALKTQHPSPADLVGSRITGVSRLGKMIDIETTDPAGAPLHVIVHFGHDGWVLWHDSAPEGLTRAGDATLMARFRLDDGAGFDLTDAGQWKALTVHLVADPAEVPAIAKLGLDPMGDEFTPERFAAILAGRRKQVKALLQDQTAFAGIGNAYSDEILHAAKISPLTHAASLSRDEVARLGELTREILTDATHARRGVAPSELRDTKRAALRVHRQTGATCPVCGDVIREFTFSGAAAQYCPTCQTGGALLA